MSTRFSPATSDREAVEAIVQGAGTSFYRGMRILPRERRGAMYAVYAFCRSVDDVADGAMDAAEKHAALDRWRARIDALYRGEATDALTRMLALAASRYALRPGDFHAVIDGMAMDAEQAIVAPDLATLECYCDRVAGAVGRLSVRIFGDRSAAADEVAAALGRALQLTNILRDLAEDAARGRLYLPREWLAAASVPADPEMALAASNLPLVCQRTAALAHESFAQASAAMRACDRRAMRPARLMGATYLAILERLEARGWQRVAEPVALPGWQKLWILLRHGLL